jgi:predicted nucleic acid-binding protein
MNRPLSDIPTGASVMLDANVLVYALTPQAQLHAACRNLLERGARGTASLFTSVSVTADVLHRAMVLEPLAQGQAQRSAEAVALLKQRPDLVPQLTATAPSSATCARHAWTFFPSPIAICTPIAKAASRSA